VSGEDELSIDERRKIIGIFLDVFKWLINQSILFHKPFIICRLVLKKKIMK